MAKFSESSNEQNFRNKNFKELRRRMWEKNHKNWSEFQNRDEEIASEHRGHGYHAQEVGPGFYGKGPKNWTRSDELVREDVCEALYESYDVDASDIEVEVKEGLVTLKGSVNSRFAKKEAELCIEYLRGVVDVINELKIKPIRPVSERGLLDPGFETGFS